MRALVTGAAGFIGSSVVDALRAAGHDVIGLDAVIEQAHGPGAQAPEGVRPVDLRAPRGLDGLLAGVDVVCHQAAMVGAGVDPSDLPAFAAHNDLGTARLLAAMALAGVPRLVLASSMVVYGDGRYQCEKHGAQGPSARLRADLDEGQFDPVCPLCGETLDWCPVDEAFPVDPLSGYAASKVAQEHYARAWSRQADASVIALRYHNVYGPGMPQDTPYSGVAAIFRSAVERGDRPQVFEDGGQMRDFVHVSDVAAANVMALEVLVAAPPSESFEPLNVCSGEPISIGSVAAAVAAGSGAGGTDPATTGEYRLGDVRHIVASPTRAAQRLGFRAQIRPADGLVTFATAPLRSRSATSA